MVGGKLDSLRRRFEAKVARTGDCHLWTAYCTPSGYGEIGVGGKYGGTVRAHRAAWELYVGPIPAGLRVLHRCDVRRCVNPAHLWLGTQQENMVDMRRKGRAGAPPRVISDEQMAYARHLYTAERHTCSQLAVFFGVCEETIRRQL